MQILPKSKVRRNLKYETYDINKDQKFLYARELLKFKEKRGIDVLELMQKIDKKQILNKMA